MDKEVIPELNLDQKLQNIENKYSSALAKLKQFDEKFTNESSKSANSQPKNAPVESSRVTVEYPISVTVNNHKGKVSNNSY